MAGTFFGTPCIKFDLNFLTILKLNSLAFISDVTLFLYLGAYFGTDGVIQKDLTSSTVVVRYHLFCFISLYVIRVYGMILRVDIERVIHN